MTFYLMDFENVRKSGFDGLDGLSSNDKIIIFYSEHADLIPIEVHSAINASPAHFEFSKVFVGSKNALDFQLCSYLGFLINDSIQKQQQDSFYIVSNDSCYLVLPVYWKNYGVSVRVVSNLARENIKKDVLSVNTDPVHGNEPDILAEGIASELLKIAPNRDTAVHWTMFAGKTKDCNEVNKFFIQAKNNNTKKAGEVYRVVRPAIGNPGLAKKVANLIKNI